MWQIVQDQVVRDREGHWAGSLGQDQEAPDTVHDRFRQSGVSALEDDLQEGDLCQVRLVPVQGRNYPAAGSFG